MPRPKLSFLESDLIKGGKAPPSAHEVIKISFIDKDGSKKHGFFKPCDAGFPEILAKYDVAFSAFVRLALGERASEDRLVYGDDGRVSGVVSIEIPNFIPLQTKAEKPLEDPEEQKLANPDKQTLIEYNIAELLISAYKHQNNDVHPGNISLKGLIDHDELYPPLISIIKGQRIGSGVIHGSAKQTCEYKEDDVRNFPKVSSRIHWPTYSYPSNLNLMKAHKAYAAFLELQGDKEFTHQYFYAILKELIAYDYNTLQQRLELYLGNETLHLEDLPSEQCLAILAFGKEGKIFFERNGKARNFVDHCLVFFAQQHQKFKTVILNMPEFKDFLQHINKNPAQLLNLQRWALKQNEENIVPFSLKTFDKTYHELWHACFKKEFDLRLAELNDIINITIKISDIDKSRTEKKQLSLKEIDKLIKKNTTPSHCILSNFVSIIESPEDKDYGRISSSINSHINNIPLDFYNNLNSKIIEYNFKRNATKTDNEIFISKVQEMIFLSMAKQNELKSWLLETEKYANNANISVLLIKFETLKFNLNEVCKDLEEFFPKLRKLLKDFELSYNISEAPPKLKLMTIEEEKIYRNPIAHPKPLLNPNQVTDSLSISSLGISSNLSITKNLSLLLKLWLNKLSKKQLKETIRDIRLKNYAPSSKGVVFGTVYSMFRTRGEEVDSMPLEKIFLTGGWNESSLNTIIVKSLCLKMLTSDLSNPFKKKTYQTIKDLEDTWWKDHAKDIADKALFRIEPYRETKKQVLAKLY